MKEKNIILGKPLVVRREHAMQHVLDFVIPHVTLSVLNLVPPRVQ